MRVLGTTQVTACVTVICYSPAVTAVSLRLRQAALPPRRPRGSGCRCSPTYPQGPGPALCAVPILFPAPAWLDPPCHPCRGAPGEAATPALAQLAGGTDGGTSTSARLDTRLSCLPIACPLQFLLPTPWHVLSPPPATWAGRLGTMPSHRPYRQLQQQRTRVGWFTVHLQQTASETTVL